MAADLVQVYSGHEGSVRSFAWRYSTTYNRYQLISWGDDKKLRFFRVERHHVKECGHVEEGRYASRRNSGHRRATHSVAQGRDNYHCLVRPERHSAFTSADGALCDRGLR